MLIKTEAIVLSKIKYRDSDLIVKCYTNIRGTVSYLLPGALKNGKGSSKAAYFQPLSLLALEENFRANRSLQFVKEVKLKTNYQSLYTNIPKGAIVMFLAEVLSMVLKEEEENTSLFGFLESAFLWLDHQQDYSNFHLMFLLKLTKFLGFYPNDSTDIHSVFNLSTGQFENFQHPLYGISRENSLVLKQFLATHFEGITSIKLNSEKRLSF
ncbi:MAG TPA: DNA repair protein RecO, partial [Aquaticitalea sp.]|nr:DNA repair protein RecO [Aquaticitalea sp.]